MIDRKVKVIRVPIEFYRCIEDFKIKELKMPGFDNSQTIRLMMEHKRLQFPDFSLKRKKVRYDMDFRF